MLSMSTLCAHLVSCLTGLMSRRKRRFSQRLQPLKSQTESIDGSWSRSRTKDYVIHKIENGQIFWFDGDKWPVRKSCKNRFVTHGNDESWTIELRSAGTLFWIDDAEDNIWHRVDEQEVSVNLSLQNIHFSTCRNKKKYRTSQQVEESENENSEDNREQQEEKDDEDEHEDEDEQQQENKEKDEENKEKDEENKEKDSGNYNFLFSKIYIL